MITVATRAIDLDEVPATPATHVLHNILMGSGASPSARFTRGVRVSGAPGAQASVGAISHNMIQGFNTAIEVLGLSPVIDQNILVSNVFGIKTGPSLQSFPTTQRFYGLPSVVGNTVRSNLGTAIRCEGGAVEIRGNTVVDNGGMGIQVASGPGPLFDNVVMNNAQIGVVLEDSLVPEAPDPSAVLHGNTLIGNHRMWSMPYQLDVRIPARFGPVDASANYWGVESEFTIRERIHDGEDPINSSKAVVEVCPYIGHDGTLVPCDF